MTRQCVDTIDWGGDWMDKVFEAELSPEMFSDKERTPEEIERFRRFEAEFLQEGQTADKVPGGRYYEPQEDRMEEEQEQEWEEFQQWVADNNGIPADPELPFN